MMDSKKKKPWIKGTVEKEGEDERRKKYTSDEAVKMAVDTVKGMGLSDYYKSLIDEAEKRGYEKAINEMKAWFNKMNL